MFWKLLVGSCGSIWFAVRKVRVFLTACVVGSCDTQAEQVAEWEEMCMCLELFCFSAIFVSHGTSTVCLPSLKVVLPAFLETVDLSHICIKRRKRVTSARCVRTALLEMLAVYWVAAALAVLQLAMKDKACPKILWSHKSDSAPFNWKWLGCKIGTQGTFSFFLYSSRWLEICCE